MRIMMAEIARKQGAIRWAIYDPDNSSCSRDQSGHSGSAVCPSSSRRSGYCAFTKKDGRFSASSLGPSLQKSAVDRDKLGMDGSAGTAAWGGRSRPPRWKFVTILDRRAAPDADKSQPIPGPCSEFTISSRAPVWEDCASLLPL